MKYKKGIFLAIIFRSISFIICVTAVVLPIHKSRAQNQPIYNQFFLNPFIYNPAYAGKNPNSMAYLNYRQQWVGIDGAPVSYTFMYDTEIKKGLSFGVIAQNDTRGIISTSSGQLTIGYGIKFNDDQGLRFGLSAGAGTNSLDISDGFNDTAIQNALENNFFLIGRVGLNYYFKNINLSFSVPDIIKRQFLSENSLTTIDIDPLDNFIGMASAKINLAPKTLTFSPHILYRGTKDGTSHVEAVGVFDIKEIVWIGGSFRQNYGVTGLAGIKVQNYLTLGYGYEIPTAGISGVSNATHEIQLSIRLGKDKVKEAEEKKARLEAKHEKQRIAHEKLLKKRKEEKEAKEKKERQARETEQRAIREEKERLEREVEERAAQAKREVDERAAQVERDLAEIEVQDKLDKNSTSEVIDKPVVLIKGDAKDELQEDHYVIVGSYNESQHAEKYANQLKKQGYNVGFGYSTEKQHYYVHIYKSSSADEARSQRDKFREYPQFKDAWHLEVLVNDIQESGSNPQRTKPIAPDDEAPVIVKKGNHMLELNQGHYVVVGAFGKFENAENYSDKIFGLGYTNSFGFSSEKQLYYIYIHQGDTPDQTRFKRNELRKIRMFKDAWYLLVEEE